MTDNNARCESYCVGCGLLLWIGETCLTNVQDGTLLDSQHTLLHENVEAISKATASGIRVFVATGCVFRGNLTLPSHNHFDSGKAPGSWCDEALVKLNLDTPRVFLQGQYITCKDGGVLHKNPVSEVR